MTGAGLMCVTLIGLPATAAEQPLGLPSSQEARFHHVRSWTLEDGLPQNTITDIEQAPRGYLWLGTFGGLARFDGVRFEVWDPTAGLADPRIVALAQKGDSLWIGHQRRGMTRFDIAQGVFRPVRLPDAVSRRGVADLFVADETLWASGPGWLGRAERGEWSVRDGPPEIRRAARDGDGDLWVGGPDYLARTRAAGAPMELVRDGGIVVHRLASDPEGRIWVLHDDGLSVVRDGRLEPRLRNPAPTWEVSGPVFARDGAVWLGLGKTAYRHPSRSALAASDDLETNLRALTFARLPATTRTMFEDRERNLWVGTSGRGLVRLTVEPFTLVAKKEGLPESSVTAVLSDGSGGLWLGNGCAGAYRVIDGALRERAFAGRCVAALARDARGRLFGGADELLERREAGQERAYSLPAECGSISAFEVDGEERLWIGTESGCVLTWSHARLARLESPMDDRVNFIEEGPGGAMWFGETSRAFVRREGIWREIDYERGAPRGAVRAIHLDGDVTWLGSYGGGIARLDKSGFTRFDESNGLGHNFVSDILDDGRGRMWFNGNGGAFRVPRRDFDLVRSGAASLLRSHPLPTGEAEVGSPSSFFDGDRIAYPTIDGLVVIDLDLLRRVSPPPAVVIETARVGDAELGLEGENRLGGERRRFEARFTAPLLRWPHLATFEHRLIGAYEGWRRTDQRSVTLEGLAPATIASRSEW